MGNYLVRQDDTLEAVIETITEAIAAGDEARVLRALSSRSLTQEHLRALLLFSIGVQSLPTVELLVMTFGAAIDIGAGSAITKARDEGAEGILTFLCETLSRRSLGNLLGLMTDAVVLTNNETRIIGFNDSAVALFGYSRSQSIGNMVDDLLIYHSELQAIHKTYVSEYHRTKERRLIGTPRIVTASHADGSPLRVEISLGVVDNGFVATFRRVDPVASTNFHVDDGAVKTTALSKLVSSMADAVVTASKEARILSINQAAHELFLWKESELVGKSVTSLMWDRDLRGQHHHYVQTYQQTGLKQFIGVARAVFAKNKKGDKLELEITLSELEDRTFIAVFRRLRDSETLAYELETSAIPSSDRSSTSLSQSNPHSLSNSSFIHHGHGHGYNPHAHLASSGSSFHRKSPAPPDSSSPTTTTTSVGGASSESLATFISPYRHSHSSVPSLEKRSGHGHGHGSSGGVGGSSGGKELSLQEKAQQVAEKDRTLDELNHSFEGQYSFQRDNVTNHLVIPTIEANDFEGLRKLRMSGASFSVCGDDGLFPIHHAILSENILIIEYLLECGASPHVRDSDGRTPLAIAEKSLLLECERLEEKEREEPEKEEEEEAAEVHSDSEAPAKLAVLQEIISILEAALDNDEDDDQYLRHQFAVAMRGSDSSREEAGRGARSSSGGFDIGEGGIEDVGEGDGEGDNGEIGRNGGFGRNRLTMSVYSAELFFEKEIGRGSFGVVYKGKWRYVPVAIKLVKVVSTDYLEDIAREAALMLDLRPHPNVVSLLGVCSEEGQYSIITEYLGGGSLDTQVYSSNPPSDPVMLRIILDVAMGVAHLHQERIVHRDIASRNVLLTNDWRAKISDFGFAKVGQKHTDQRDRVAGPVRWMAPEALTFNAFSVASDVWSFGIMVYECASHLLPHANYEFKELAIAIGTQGLIPSLPADTSPVLKELTEACWKQAPGDRASFHWIITHLAEHIDSAAYDDYSLSLSSSSNSASEKEGDEMDSLRKETEEKEKEKNEKGKTKEKKKDSEKRERRHRAKDTKNANRRKSRGQ